MPEPIARSPIRPVSGTRRAAPLTLTDMSALAKILVRAGPAGGMAGALGVPFGRASRDGSDALVCGSAPGEWLVLGPAGEASALAGRLAGLAAREADDELVSVLDLTHGIALMRLAGPLGAATLAGICGVDLSERTIPAGSVFSSLVAGVVTGVVRDDVPDASPSYLLHCERSYGQYLFDVTLDAGAEFGIQA